MLPSVGWKWDANQWLFFLFRWLLFQRIIPGVRTRLNFMTWCRICLFSLEVFWIYIYIIFKCIYFIYISVSDFPWHTSFYINKVTQENWWRRTISQNTGANGKIWWNIFYNYFLEFYLFLHVFLKKRAFREHYCKFFIF